jgi:hypothetical protein
VDMLALQCQQVSTAQERTLFLELVMQQRADGRRCVNFAELAVAFNARVLERWDNNDAASLRVKTAQTLRSYAAKVSQQGALAETHNAAALAAALQSRMVAQPIPAEQV